MIINIIWHYLQFVQINLQNKNIIIRYNEHNILNQYSYKTRACISLMYTPDTRVLSKILIGTEVFTISEIFDFIFYRKE